MPGIELVELGTDTPSPARATRVQEKARHRGLLLGIAGLYDQVIRLAPPMPLTDSETDEGLNALAEALATTYAK
ncbi:hypothetical protein V7793_09710 [Streptomyces sp. KLMMK]|uniref:hypothetical protein n=1 Tax=Streptomyces sp. KLMMK TaxID=3109353 RepID=UPI003009FB19